MMECHELVLANGKYVLRARAKMKYARHGHSACAVGSNYLAITGSRKDTFRTSHRFEIFDIEKNSWQEGPLMN